MKSEDEVIIRFPDRAWAEVAIEDLAGAGCRAELLAELDCEGLWQVRVTGCQEHLDQLRLAAQPALPKVDWETFVNAAVKSV